MKLFQQSFILLYWSIQIAKYWFINVSGLKILGKMKIVYLLIKNNNTHIHVRMYYILTHTNKLQIFPFPLKNYIFSSIHYNFCLFYRYVCVLYIEFLYIRYIIVCKVIFATFNYIISWSSNERNFYLLAPLNTYF